MKYFGLLFLSIVFLHCSSQEFFRSGSPAESHQSFPLVKNSESDAARGSSSDTRSNGHKSTDGITSSLFSTSEDTVRGPTLSSEQDTVEQQQLYISQKLEAARLHYLAALAAQEVGDSTLCAVEFESAIAALDELSYLPDIESNKEFTDLSQSVLEDYEKYIASIDNLSSGASVFALREKISQIIEKVDPETVKFPHEEIAGTAVPLPLNEPVKRNIAFFMGERGRKHFEKWLQLSGRYFPLMRRIFREENVPEELLYLSMVESGLRPEARSWASAVGLWQFMKGTGHLYGLRGNWWYDERRDFEKSTRAAARHLKDLYGEFGDWHVVLAAYNAGAGRVYRAIRRSGSTDYWAMRVHLPRQTQNYVPQFIAVARMAMKPEEYGFRGIDLADSLAYEVVTIDDCVDLRVLAKCAETDVETLRSLNPELLQWCTPPGVTGYRLRIPLGRTELFTQNYAQIPDDQKRDWGVHTVRRGETLSAIARRYGLTAELLANVNTVKNIRKISVGTQLAIPLPKELMSSRSKVPFEYDRPVQGMDFNQLKAYIARTDASRRLATTPKNVAGRERLVYRVKRGDTIGHIAEWYGVRASDLRNWNNIPYGSLLAVNQEITIWVEPSRAAALRNINELSFAEKQSLRGERLNRAGLFGNLGGSPKQRTNNGWIRYSVRRGDTLEKIAKEHGVSIVDLKVWNGLRSSRITVGQELDIYTEPEERTSIIQNTAPRRQTTPPKSSEVVHHVKKGETLWSIAKMYGITVQDLERHNQLSDVLMPGDRLIIPQR